MGAVPLGAHDPRTRGAAGRDRARRRARRALGAHGGPHRRGRAASRRWASGSAPSLFFATAAVAAAAMFMAVGLLVGQLAATRHDANLIGAGVLAASYLIRMVADSAPGLAWLRWASPLGWIEELRPLTGSQPFAFVLDRRAGRRAGDLAIQIARGRDLGRERVREPRRVPAANAAAGRPGRPDACASRGPRSSAGSWRARRDRSGLRPGRAGGGERPAQARRVSSEAIARLGGSSAGAASYLGFVFVVAAGLVAIAVAGQIAATRNEEAAGHLDNLLVRPVARVAVAGRPARRGRWVWSSSASALVGVAAWVGAVSQHADVGFGDLAEGGSERRAPGRVRARDRRARLRPVATGRDRGRLRARRVVVPRRDDLRGRRLEPLAARHVAAPAHRAGAGGLPNWTAAAWLVGLGLLAAVAGRRRLRPARPGRRLTRGPVERKGPRRPFGRRGLAYRSRQCVPAPTGSRRGFASSGTASSGRRPTANAQMPTTNMTAPPTITVQMIGANATDFIVS